ncbi:recombinase family protein [Hyphomonas jannaschiana]|uniref:Resolvase domain protein n=1 Tax=Hyphomonas jannaschiana VP2 TaxID=1280952 RepID=A0A059FGJ4_9PROT|nr:recombinase family protein [Hyphomonas jannaschiana]KCZ89732.1 Resolvase domain protein [Hyphomonas jannaschiana VP2]
MRIGYARVSTGDQSLSLQLDALEAFGCERIYKDHGVSALASRRPGLERALRRLSPGDVLVIWRLDRLGRSLLDLLDITTALQNRDIGLHSLCESIDTASASGRLILQVMAAVAEFERSILIERTRAGMEAARARGAKFGRKPALDGEELREALFLLRRGMKVPELADHMGVGKSTMYRYIAGSPGSDRAA